MAMMRSNCEKYSLYGIAKITKLVLVVLCCLSLNSCVGAVVGATVDTAIEVVKIPFKVTGAAVDIMIPDGDDDD